MSQHQRSVSNDGRDDIGNQATRRAVFQSCVRKQAYPTMEDAERDLQANQGVYLCSWGGHWHRTTKRSA